MTGTRHPLVEDYLKDLEKCAARLPRHQRSELLDELREHLDTGAADATSEVDIRNMLDSLGAPEGIVEEAAPRSGAAASSGQLALGFGIGSLILLMFGPFAIPVAIPLAVAAIVLGIRARRHLRAAGLPTSAATGALVTGGIAVLVPLLLFSLLMPAH